MSIKAEGFRELKVDDSALTRLRKVTAWQAERRYSLFAEGVA
jgi:hypothetical protein